MLLSASRRLPAAAPISSRPEQPAEAAWPHHTLLLVFVWLWGGNFVLAELALRDMSPLSFSVSRFAVGGGALLLVLYAQYRRECRRPDGRRRLFPSVARADWPRLLLVALLGAALAPWLGIEGLALTHGARASLWLALGPALSAGVGVLLRTERLGRPGLAGVALAGLGTVALAADGLDPARSYWLGDLLLFSALALAVLELHLIKPLARRYGATAMVAARTALGGLLYLLLAAPSLSRVAWTALQPWTWVAILAGGALGVGIGQWVKVRALHRLGPTRVVLYGNLVPVAALWLAWWALGTVPTLLELCAAALIIAGALCLQYVDARSAVATGRALAPAASTASASDAEVAGTSSASEARTR